MNINKSIVKITIACLVFVFLISGALVLKQSSKPNQAKAQIGPTPAGYPTSFQHDIFKDYASWHNSATFKTDDALLRALFLMGNSDNVAAAQSFMDINADGFPDILYHDRWQTSASQEYAVFLNNGNLGFALAYKCYFKDWVYYGDCSQ